MGVQKGKTFFRGEGSFKSHQFLPRCAGQCLFLHSGGWGTKKIGGKANLQAAFYTYRYDDRLCNAAKPDNNILYTFQIIHSI